MPSTSVTSTFARSSARIRAWREIFIRWSDAYGAATTLPVNCGDSRLSLGCESFGREARYARARSVLRGPIQIETAAILYGRSSLAISAVILSAPAFCAPYAGPEE